MLGHLDVCPGVAGFFQLEIARKDERCDDGKEQGNKNEQNANDVAEHGPIINVTAGLEPSRCHKHLNSNFSCQ
jgi:hypothetical protein